MVKSQTNWRMRSSVAVALLLFVGASCTGGDDSASDDPSSASAPTDTSNGDFTSNDGSVVAPTTIPLPECPVDEVAIPDDWPFGVAAVIVPTAASRDDELFLVRGVTNQPEAALIATMDEGFDGFEVDEPTGGDNDISVQFTSVNGTGDLRMADDDVDGCWDVELTALYEPGATPPPSVGTSEPDSVVPDASTPDSGSVDTDVPSVSSTVAPSDTIDPLDEVNAVGTGEVITGRSTFQVKLTVCDTDPLLIEAVAAGGTLTIEGDPIGVITTWTYDDGEIITSNESKVIGLDARGGSVVADGRNADGPETIFATFICDDV